MTEYPLNKASSIEDIVKVLEAMKAEAKQEAQKLALDWTLDPGGRNSGKRDEALWLMGQHSAMESLHWALSGKGEDEGISNPTVEVREFGT